MEIQVPKTDTGGQEKSKDQWETIVITSTAETEQTITLSELLGHFSKLSQRTKDIDTQLDADEKRIKSAEDNATKILKITEDTRALVIFGFFVLLLMIAGLVFAYWQFTYENGLAMQEKISEIERQSDALDSLKKCLSAGGWSSCLDQ